jgi:hypothetical protein
MEKSTTTLKAKGGRTTCFLLQFLYHPSIGRKIAVSLL